jgi:DNA topoisomerase-2
MLIYYIIEKQNKQNRITCIKCKIIKSMSKEISKKYELLDEIQHVLKRPGMYVGSTKPHSSKEFLFNSEKFIQEEVTYNPGFLKLFDEIVSNSIDESKRNTNLNQIHVTFNPKNNEISVWDNGGIPVIKHSDHGIWIPELIFSNLRAGSNFDDTQDRIVAGTNGVGASLTNIFSKKFTIKTSDGKNQFVQVFSDNMSNRTEPKITQSDKKFTELSYIVDFSQFGMDGVDEVHIDMMRKRLMDIAACNPNVKIQYNNEKFKFRTFKDYAELYVDSCFYERSDNWEIAIAPTNLGYTAVSFVNSIETKEGGNHVNYITNQIIDSLRGMIKKKHKVDIRPTDIKNHMMVFINSTIINPAFSSQTKEKLITEPKDFGSIHEVSDKMIKQIFGSEIVASILDWIESKKQADERAQLRKLNKDLNTSKILKLIDAKSKNNREECTLGIFEGDSAKSAVREFRDPQLFGAFPLKGKFLNVSEMKNTEVIKNEEVINLMGSLGLRLGEEPTNLRYGKILIYTDADPDGDAIAGLLINFLAKYWPELFDQGRIYRVLTPIVVSQKGKEWLSFYSKEEYQEWESKTNTKGWNSEYKKGLAALESQEYEQIIQNPKTIRITNDKLGKESLNAWFGGDSIHRKTRLLKF